MMRRGVARSRWDLGGHFVPRTFVSILYILTMLYKIY
jgi:hypothetical protein